MKRPEDIVPSITRIFLFLIVMAMSASVGSIITPFMFVYFACQTYKHMKQFEREVLEISENKSKQRKDDNHDCKHKRKY